MSSRLNWTERDSSRSATPVDACTTASTTRCRSEGPNNGSATLHGTNRDVVHCCRSCSMSASDKRRSLTPVAPSRTLQRAAIVAIAPAFARGDGWGASAMAIPEGWPGAAASGSSNGGWGDSALAIPDGWPTPAPAPVPAPASGGVDLLAGGAAGSAALPVLSAPSTSGGVDLLGGAATAMATAAGSVDLLSVDLLSVPAASMGDLFSDRACFGARDPSQIPLPVIISGSLVLRAGATARSNQDARAEARRQGRRGR